VKAVQLIPRPAIEKVSMGDSEVNTVSHMMIRVDIPTQVSFDDFISRFEDAAPVFDAEPFQRIVEADGSWADVQAAVETMAPHSLMRYATIEATALMSLAGHTTKAVEYLLGNHVIAETMFRHDPRALLYAPLRVVVFSDSEGDAVGGL
jgi:hypothetical protein